MPHLRARLCDGDLSPEAVPVIITALSHLALADRHTADRRLCGDPATLAGLGVRRIQDLVVKLAYELDRQASVDRIAQAARDRRVTIRPEPDAMARVSILLPVAHAVSIYAALKIAADNTVGVGVEVRTRGQVMADYAYELITGRTVADPIPVAVNLTISANTLLGEQPGTAHLTGTTIRTGTGTGTGSQSRSGSGSGRSASAGSPSSACGGVLPAEIARNLIGKATAQGLAWVKRLYVTPETGAVVAMDSRARAFPTGLADIIAARDHYCRTPYCDAPIAHTDHVTAHHTGGETSYANGQGLCAACNYTKQAPDWISRTINDPSGRHTVETITPAGHSYRSIAPETVT